MKRKYSLYQMAQSRFDREFCRTSSIISTEEDDFIAHAFDVPEEESAREQLVVTHQQIIDEQVIMDLWNEPTSFRLDRRIFGECSSAAMLRIHGIGRRILKALNHTAMVKKVTQSHREVFHLFYLGDREDKGFVTVTIQWSTDDDLSCWERYYLTFTLMKHWPSIAMLKDDLPNTAALLQEVNAALPLIMNRRMNKWFTSQREKMVPLGVFVVNIPYHRPVSRPILEERIGEIVTNLFVQLKHRMEECGSELELEKVSIDAYCPGLHLGRFEKESEWQKISILCRREVPHARVKIVKKQYSPFSHVLSFESRRDFLSLCADDVLGAKPAFNPFLPSLEGVIASERCAHAFDRSLDTLFDPQRRANHWRVTADSLQNGNEYQDEILANPITNLYMKIDVNEKTDPRFDLLLSSSSGSRKYTVKTRLKFNRHYFPYFSFSASHCQGVIALSPSNVFSASEDDANWLLGLTNVGMTTDSPQMAWSNPANDSFLTTTLLLRGRQRIYVLQMEMIDKPLKGGTILAHHIISVRVAYVREKEMRIAFKPLLAQMNAEAMMRRLENEIFDHPMRALHWLRQLKELFQEKPPATQSKRLDTSLFWSNWSFSNEKDGRERTKPIPMLIKPMLFIPKRDRKMSCRGHEVPTSGYQVEEEHILMLKRRRRNPPPEPIDLTIVPEQQEEEEEMEQVTTDDDEEEDETFLPSEEE